MTGLLDAEGVEWAVLADPGSISSEQMAAVISHCITTIVPCSRSASARSAS